MGAAGLVELLQIGQVLEVVGVLVAVLHGGVGHHVVAVLVDHQLDALLRQDGHALVQNLGVGGGRGGHRQGDGLSGIAAAGGQGQAQGQAQQQGQQLLFHVSFLQ